MTIYALGDDMPLIADSAYVAHEATLIGKVVLKDNASVWPGATLRGDNELITIGAGSNVQEGAVLHTDPGCPLEVGGNVTVGHQAMLHGCTVGDGSLIGIQAVVLNNAVIGKDCLIGACALVTTGMTIPDRSMVLGSPAKIVRELTAQEIDNMHRGIASYVTRAARYKQQLKKIN